ncbi:RHS domain-containing protein [Escherichia coli]
MWLTDTSGQVVWKASYSPFGNCTSPVDNGDSK